jgi:hypothetical protein
MNFLPSRQVLDIAGATVVDITAEQPANAHWPLGRVSV